MTAAELLAAEVVDENGNRLGKVHDLRLRRTGGSDSWALDAIVVGPTAFAYRLGYTSRDDQGPRLLAGLVRRLTRRTRHIAWRDVVTYADGCVTVRAGE